MKKSLPLILVIYGLSINVPAFSQTNENIAPPPSINIGAEDWYELSWRLCGAFVDGFDGSGDVKLVKEITSQSKIFTNGSVSDLVTQYLPNITCGHDTYMDYPEESFFLRITRHNPWAFIYFINEVILDTVMEENEDVIRAFHDNNVPTNLFNFFVNNTGEDETTLLDLINYILENPKDITKLEIWKEKFQRPAKILIAWGGALTAEKLKGTDKLSFQQQATLKYQHYSMYAETRNQKDDAKRMRQMAIDNKILDRWKRIQKTTAKLKTLPTDEKNIIRNRISNLESMGINMKLIPTGEFDLGMKFVRDVRFACTHDEEARAFYTSQELMNKYNKGVTYEDCEHPMDWYRMPSGGPDVHVVNLSPLFSVAQFYKGYWGEKSDDMEKVFGNPRGIVESSFYMAETEVTLGQWQECVNDGACVKLKKTVTESNKNYPVSNINFAEVQRFLIWINKKTGGNFYLPLEVQWEWAARGQSKNTLYPWGQVIDKTKTNCEDCNTPYAGKVAPVGSFQANKFGLYDVVGNVAEMVQGCKRHMHMHFKKKVFSTKKPLFHYCADSLLLKGPNYNTPMLYSFTASRSTVSWDARHDATGFRLAHDVF
jgi:hypothetical protein